MATINAFRATYRFALVNSQAANSRLFELRNPGTNGVIAIPISLTVRFHQSGAATAAIADSLDLYRVTDFSAVDPTNATTITAPPKQPGMTAAIAQVRAVAATGLAAGMTGGTMTKDTLPLASVPFWLTTAVPTANVVIVQAVDVFSPSDPIPTALGPNQGLVLENRVVLGAAANVQVYVDVSWKEVTEY